MICDERSCIWSEKALQTRHVRVTDSRWYEPDTKNEAMPLRIEAAVVAVEASEGQARAEIATPEPATRGLFHFAFVAQLVERLPCKQDVRRSNRPHRRQVSAETPAG